MRHDGGPQDPDGEIEGVGIGQRRKEPAGDPGQVRAGHEDLEQEAPPDRSDQDQDERLHLPDSGLVEKQDQERVEGGDQDPVQEGDAEQQFQPDGRPDHLSEISYNFV